MEIKENNLKELIEKYMSIEETEENHEELHQLGHEIDHVIFDNNFYLVTHNDGEEKEIVSFFKIISAFFPIPYKPIFFSLY